MNPKKRTHAAFTLVELLVVIAIIGVLIALLLPAVQAAREAARRMSCSNKLKQIALGLQGYHDTYGRFPAGGLFGPGAGDNLIGFGFHAALLPYLEQKPVYDSLNFSVGIQSASNLVHAGSAAEVFRCPSYADDDTDQVTPYEVEKWAVANYVGVSGAEPPPGYGLPSSYMRQYSDSACRSYYTNGVLFPYSDIAIRDITDGTSHTLALGERTYELRGWMRGAYYTGSRDNPTMVCSAGSKSITKPINSDPLKYCYLNCPNGRTVFFNELFFGSHHPGGANFARADGSVTFIENEIDMAILKAMATRDGGETIE